MIWTVISSIVLAACVGYVCYHIGMHRGWLDRIEFEKQRDSEAA